MIDSRFRSSGTHENFVHHLGEGDFHQCRYVQLKDITFNNTMYNITVKNNRLTWFDSFSMQYDIIIPIGHYTSGELQQYINTTTTSVYPLCPIQFSANTKTMRFTITNTSSFHLSPVSTILNVIGFENPSQIDQTSHIATQMYNFLVTRHVHIISNALAECDAFIANNGKKYAVIASVPVNVPFGGVVNLSEEKTSADESFHNSNINLSTVDIRLVDNNFEVIDLNGSNIIMNFTIKKN
jgi:hypothetical protein